jgi:hypothetical protein
VILCFVRGPANHTWRSSALADYAVQRPQGKSPPRIPREHMRYEDVAILAAPGMASIPQGSLGTATGRRSRPAAGGERFVRGGVAYRAKPRNVQMVQMRSPARHGLGRGQIMARGAAALRCLSQRERRREDRGQSDGGPARGRRAPPKAIPTPHLRVQGTEALLDRLSPIGCWSATKLVATAKVKMQRICARLRVHHPKPSFPRACFQQAE